MCRLNSHVGKFIYGIKSFCLKYTIVPVPDPDPDWIRIQVSRSGSVSRRANVHHKSRKKIHVLKCWMFSFLRAKGFYCTVAWTSVLEAQGLKIKNTDNFLSTNPDPDWIQHFKK